MCELYQPKNQLTASMRPRALAAVSAWAVHSQSQCAKRQQCHYAAHRYSFIPSGPRLHSRHNVFQRLPVVRGELSFCTSMRQSAVLLIGVRGCAHRSAQRDSDLGIRPAAFARAVLPAVELSDLKVGREGKHFRQLKDGRSLVQADSRSVPRAIGLLSGWKGRWRP